MQPRRVGGVNRLMNFIQGKLKMVKKYTDNISHFSFPFIITKERKIIFGLRVKKIFDEQKPREFTINKLWLKKFPIYEQQKKKKKGLT